MGSTVFVGVVVACSVVVGNGRRVFVGTDVGVREGVAEGDTKVMSDRGLLATGEGVSSVVVS